MLVHYGNLIRNFLKNSSSDRYESTYNKYKTFFEKAKNAYQVAQKTPKKYKIPQQNNDDKRLNDSGSYNDYAFLGEIFLYINELQILYDLKNIKTEKKVPKLENVLQGYEKRIIYIMDTFEDYSNDGKIYLSESDGKKENTRIEDIKKEMGNALIRLLEMKSSKDLENKRIGVNNLSDETRFKLIKELIDSVRGYEYNVFIIIKSHKSLKIKSWEDLKANELKLIVDYMKEIVETKDKPLYSSFQNLIYSLIFYGQVNVDQDNDKYNIYTGLEYCKRWRSNYNDKFDAFFFSGIFQLVVDLQENINDSDSKNHFADCQKKCKELLEQNYNPREYKIKEFFLGCGRGIKAIVPFKKNQKNQNLNELQKFKGRISRNQNFYKIIEVDNPLLNKFSINAGRIPTEINRNDQTPRFFNLAFARDNLVAENINKVIIGNLSSSDED